MPTRNETIRLEKWLPKRPQTAHKGSFGRVLVVAGSRTMCGAGFLCAKSALTSGAGLVYWALPEQMQPAFAAALPEVITLPLPQTSDGEIARNAWKLFPTIYTAYEPSLMVLGPGMGNSPILPYLLKNRKIPMILDADALNALAAQVRWDKNEFSNPPVIFTPHPGEMARLLGGPIASDQTTRRAQAEKWVQLTGGVAVLKGARTQVAARIHRKICCYQNTTGGPALAKAGSGDVLAGVIAGLWAQIGTAEGFSVDTAWKAAVCGVYLHGLAGDLAAKTKGIYSVLAQDVIAHIAQAFCAVREGA